jgi:DNA-binding transcriptional ArsR family regulator
MTKFERPTKENIAEMKEKQGNFIIPKEDIEIDLTNLSYRKQKPDKDIEQKEPIITMEGGIVEIDLAELRNLCWEHEQYSSARGFSVSQIDVLRAVHDEGGDRVFTDEIMESKWVTDYSKPTVYAALRALTEKELLKKDKKGVYSYKHEFQE